MWERRGGEIPEAWYRLPIFYFSNVSEIRGPGDAVWAPRGSEELDYELEVAALVDTPGRDLTADGAEEAIGGYMILNDWSARDLQREETTVRLGPAKGKDFATSIGPWLVTPDELADRAIRDRLRPGDDGNRQRRRDEPRHLVQHPFLVRADARAGLGRRPAPSRRPARQRDGRRRLPARDPRGDARPLPRARRRGGARGSSGSGSSGRRWSHVPKAIDDGTHPPDRHRHAGARRRSRPPVCQRPRASSARWTSGASGSGPTPRPTRACASGGSRSRQVRPG